MHRSGALRAHAAKYAIDSHRVGMAGASAGGHLAELVATADQNAGLEGNGGWRNIPASYKRRQPTTEYGILQ